MTMNPAVEAHRAFQRVCQADELGDDLDTAVEAEVTFSSEVGEAATAAYQQLLVLGNQHPEATAFQEFLIYSTWCQVMDAPIASHFRRGAQLCDQYLSRTNSSVDQTQVSQIRDLQKSFLGGLGTGSDEDDDDYEQDIVQSGE